jgi:hypothetical protein
LQLNVHSCELSNLTSAQQDTRPLEILVTEAIPRLGRSISDGPSSVPMRERGMTNTSLCSSFSAEQSSSTIPQDAHDSLSPVERFVMLSPSNDPCPWETRRVISELALNGESDASYRTRLHDAAVAVIGTSSRRQESVSVVAVAGSL